MASAGGVSNDTRGWILCAISSIACVAGACIVCVDVFIRLLPGMKSFNIQDSSAFLSSSLSLSFGVMIFSSLFSMLPSSKRYLTDDGRNDQAAGLLMIGGFALGFVGMQIVSRIIHRFMPSHVVDCDHTHDDDAEDGEPLPGSQHLHSHSHFHPHSHGHGHGHGHHHHHHHHEPPSSTHFRVGSKPTFVSRKYFQDTHASVAGALATESTPLLSSDGGSAPSVRPELQRQLSARSDGAAVAANAATQHDGVAPLAPALRSTPSLSNLRRPSMIEVRNKVISFVKDVKSNCDEFGPCYGYTDPCGQECKRNIVLRASAVVRSAFTTPLRHTATAPSQGATAVLQQPDWESTIPAVPGKSSSSSGSSSGGNMESTTVSRPVSPGASGTVPHYHHDPRDHEEMQEGDPDGNFPESGGESSTNVSNAGVSNNSSKNDLQHLEHQNNHSHAHSHAHAHAHSHHRRGHQDRDQDTDPDRYHDHDVDVANADPDGGDNDEDGDLEEAGVHGHAARPPHHHHVPANAFLSIGLQTVLAIGLHKFPEGFITFATNHANPALGFNVFLALFVHNIAEGFAMALPLYMALGSRLRAILWAAALGGLSQPVGAGMAALWLKFLARNDGDDGSSSGNSTAYGILFAVTAGIMVAVALQLFVESLTLHHNRQLTIGFAFLGMMLLGLSNSIGTH